MTLLSVNVNKIAVLRNARGGSEPNLARAVTTCLDAGCGGITVHPRPDLRHIRPDDVRLIAGLLRGRGEFNIEGNPFVPPRRDYPGLIALAREVRPAQVTLVPDSEGQITSDHGFDLVKDAPRLGPVVKMLRELGCRVSLFVDAGATGFEHAAALGVSRVEIYTGPYAHAFAAGDAEEALALCVETARRAQKTGLGVNAGHDLNQANLGTLRAAMPGLAEVSIGHALIGEALYEGLVLTISRYLQLLS